MTNANTCPNCQAPVPGDARFCTGCGGALAPPQPQATAPPMQPPVQVPPAQYAQQQQHIQQQQQQPMYPPPGAPGPSQPVRPPPPQQQQQQQQQQQRAPPSKKKSTGFGGFLKGMADAVTDMGNEASRLLSGGHVATAIRFFPPTIGPVIPEQQFNTLVHQLKVTNFMQERQKLVEQASHNYHFTCFHVQTILSVLSQDHERKTSINFLAPRIVDRQNHAQVGQGPWGYPIQNYIMQCLAQYPVGQGMQQVPVVPYGRPPAPAGAYPQLQTQHPPSLLPEHQQYQQPMLQPAQPYSGPPPGQPPSQPPTYQHATGTVATAATPVPQVTATAPGGQVGGGHHGKEGPCPKCQGKGGLGPFGAVSKGDVHYKMECPNCKGHGESKRQLLCPSCEGKGGFGPFGPCEPLDVHHKRKCPACKGKGFVKKPLQRCDHCQGKGGLGAFGACTPDDVHFKRDCDHCKGKGWKKSKC